MSTAVADTPMEVDSSSNKTTKAESSGGVTATTPHANKIAPASVTPATNTEVFSPEMLQMYYSRLFPFDTLYSWLNYSNGSNNNSYFSRREFSFTTIVNGSEEIYMRHQSFPEGQALQKAMLAKKPVKMDIGAVYEQPPKDKTAVQKGTNKPVARELIFDVDMDDYDPVRFCGCQGAKICPKCWNFMKMAIQVVDEGLREDFGFRHVAWFYSGRRGVHGWVCDEEARNLTDEGRSAVANYFSIPLGNEKNKDAKLQTPLHPTLKRAFDILEPMFIQYMLPASGHGILATHEACQRFLDQLPESAASFREKFGTKYWSAKNCSQSTPAELWQELKQHLQVFVRATAKQGAEKSAKIMTAAERSRLEIWPMEMVFRYTYPRLDINVSTHRNHLLKSPFCVHPKSGRVCVPITDAQSFDPFVVPTLPVLMQELNQTENKENAVQWKQTSLREYFEPFHKNFLDPMMQEQRRQQREEDEQKAAIVGDF